MIDAVEKNLADAKAKFLAKLDEPERLLSHLAVTIEAARAYPAYAREFGGDEIIAFTLDPTQSYAILPTGPEGHNDELTHYSWNGGGFENPQLLPEAKVIPAGPSREMKGFGCRGTTVALSFALAPEKTVEGLTFEVSDIGDIPADAVDIRYVATWWRPWNNRSKLGPRLMNEMLLHDPEFAVPLAEKKENVYKDAKFGDDTEALQPVTIEGGTVRQFYVTVEVPEDAAAGVHRGTITAKADGSKAAVMSAEVEVLRFDLEPTPLAYSFFYRSYLTDEASAKERGIHSWFKTPAQMEAELVNMAQHGCNTLNLYGGSPKATDDGWDFSELELCLAMAKRAGLTRSPFTWLGSGRYFIPYTKPDRQNVPRDMEEVVETFNRFIPAVNALCDARGYPRPALFGHDEASGEKLMKLRRGYSAVNEAGGTITVACYPSFFDEIGDALSLPIIYGGGQTLKGREAMRKSQALGYECWIYNCPATNLPASPSVYRRRYGLAMWRNGEEGAAPWEYAGVPRRRDQSPAYHNDFDNPMYAVAYPTWSGKPIDTIIYEAFREGVYDTRYMATLEKALAQAKEAGGAPELVAKVEKWLETFSVNDDLQKVRRQLADFIVALSQ